MKKIILTPSILLFATLTSSAFANTGNNIESCAKLLPQDGKHYQLSLTGTIKEDRTFDAQLNIGDNTKKPLTDAEKKATEPFVECVKRLVK